MRNILHVPGNFRVVVPRIKRPEVVLDLVSLERRESCFKRKRDRESLERGWGGYVEIDEEDIDAIMGLTFKDRVKEAKNYCLDIYDQAYEKLYNSNNFFGGLEDYLRGEEGWNDNEGYDGWLK